MTISIGFIDLQAQRERIESGIDTAILSVVESHRYVLGPTVSNSEKSPARPPHARGLSSRTRASVDGSGHMSAV